MPQRRAVDPLIEEMRDDLREIKRLLTGNGDVGLCERVRNLESRQHFLRRWLAPIAAAVAAIAAWLK
jgi:hypothetical protein